MKKKLLAMLLAVVMVCGVSGCGKDKTDATDGQQVTAELDGEMKKEADTLQKALEGYAADLTAEDAAAAGMYTIHNGAVVGGQENWDAFAAGKAAGRRRLSGCDGCDQRRLRIYRKRGLHPQYL